MKNNKERFSSKKLAITPMSENAFDISDEEKMELIEKDVRHIMEVLGLDLKDDSLKNTPRRVAKSFVLELFSGLDPKKKPVTSSFLNSYQYNEMVVEKNIVVYSTCEHHLLPIIGVAHVAYISSGKIIGLSKMNRIVNYFSKRPQVQERLTLQIVEELQDILQTEDIACMIDAKHLCVNSRGIKDISSNTITSEFRGKFKEQKFKDEFLNYIRMS
ncbi:GTP cyclohydrolase I FolE [Aureivirga sp. CE67]|uniref:GTP cyclohydrolase I FolE n=1 Tax=Aureivirga sp. CE67 TaxID=1788983 RepID=UPI0018CB73BC|nr:GTP cyclohydrolase I FolE [Aureivirga sp. CE67]